MSDEIKTCHFAGVIGEEARLSDLGGCQELDEGESESVGSSDSESLASDEDGMEVESEDEDYLDVGDEEAALLGSFGPLRRREVLEMLARTTFDSVASWRPERLSRFLLTTRSLMDGCVSLGGTVLQGPRLDSLLQSLGQQDSLRVRLKCLPGQVSHLSPTRSQVIMRSRLVTFFRSQVTASTTLGGIELESCGSPSAIDRLLLSLTLVTALTERARTELKQCSSILPVLGSS